MLIQTLLLSLRAVNQKFRIMNSKLLLLSVFILTAICAFAQNEIIKPQLDSIITVGSTSTSKQVFLYDSNGNTVTQFRYFWDSTNNIWEIRFKTERRSNDAGNLIMSAPYRWSSDNMRWIGDGIKTEWGFDDAGRRAMLANYTWDTGNNAWRGFSKAEWKYDDYNFPIMLINYNWNNENNTWAVRDKTIYQNELTFDDENRLTVWIISIWNNNSNEWINDSKTELIHGENSRIQTEFRWNTENEVWQNFRRFESDFDDNGNLMIRITYRWDGIANAWMKNRKDVFDYDNNGNRTMTADYIWDSMNDRWIGDAFTRKTLQKFDDRGNRIEDILLTWNSLHLDWVGGGSRLVYVFDSNGNLISEIRYSPNFDFNEGRWDGTWRQNRKEESFFNLSVYIADISFPVHFVGRRNINAPIKSVVYYWNWQEENWQKSSTSTYYYSRKQTNIPIVSTNSLSIFPNPASEHFTISGITENALVTVSSLTGQIMLQQTVLPNESVSVSHLPAGIYIVNVNGKSQRLIIR